MDRQEKIASIDDDEPGPSAIGEVSREYGVPVLSILKLDIIDGLRGMALKTILNDLKHIGKNTGQVTKHLILLFGFLQLEHMAHGQLLFSDNTSISKSRQHLIRTPIIQLDQPKLTQLKLEIEVALMDSER